MTALRTGTLLVALTGLCLAAGFLLDGVTGVAVASASALWACWNSDKMLLARAGARAATEPGLVHLVHRLSSRAGLPMPKIFIAANAHPNAFATGRDPSHASICLTTGLLAAVSDEELAGVLAHELGHIKHRDTLVMTIARLPLLAPIAWLAGSRAREFEADRAGAEISGDPLWLASALERLGGPHSRTHPSTEERVTRLRALAARR